MLEVNKFNTMKELINYKKELENACSDEDVLDEVKENAFMTLIETNKLIKDIQSVENTNKYWLGILLNMLSQRQDGLYQLQIISGENNNKKLYTLNDFSQMEVQEIGKSRKLYTVILTKNDCQKIDFELLNHYTTCALYPNILHDNSLIIYDIKEGELCVPLYLSEERNISELLDYNPQKGLTEKEVADLNEIVFTAYKNKNKSKKRNLKK